MKTTLSDKVAKVKPRTGIDTHSHIGWRVAIASRRFYCHGPKTPIKCKAAPVASRQWMVAYRLRWISDTGQDLAGSSRQCLVAGLLRRVSDTGGFPATRSWLRHRALLRTKLRALVTLIFGDDHFSWAHEILVAVTGASTISSCGDSRSARRRLAENLSDIPNNGRRGQDIRIPRESLSRRSTSLVDGKVARCLCCCCRGRRHAGFREDGTQSPRPRFAHCYGKFHGRPCTAGPRNRHGFG